MSVNRIPRPKPVLILSGDVPSGALRTTVNGECLRVRQITVNPFLQPVAEVCRV